MSECLNIRDLQRALLRWLLQLLEESVFLGDPPLDGLIGDHKLRFETVDLKSVVADDRQSLLVVVVQEPTYTKSASVQN